MNRIDTLKQISKMIASGTIPNDVYSKFLSECPIGFMQEKDLFNYLIGNDESKEIATNLGMDSDEVLRLKQISGLKEAFLGKEFSKSWEEFEHKHFDENGEYIEEDDE